MTKTEITTTITNLIREAGLNPADYRVAKMARLVAERIAESEHDYAADGTIREPGISEADLWEGLAADNWAYGMDPGAAASDAAYAVADSFPAGTYGRMFWANECAAAAHRNELAYAA